MGYSPRGRKESDTTEGLIKYFMDLLGFPGGSVKPPANVGDASSIPGSGRSPGE